jgi:hypothetical protein
VKITNRTNRTLTFMTRPTSNADGSISLEWIHPGQSMNRDQHGEREVYLTVATGEHSVPVAVKANALIDGGGPYLSASEFLIVAGGRKVVDWSALERKYISGSRPLSSGGDPPDRDLAQGLAVASAVLSALSTGLSATGPVGALPAGFFSFVASMVLLGEGDPPEPPDLGAIEEVVERVVERVVKEQLQQNDAKSAVSRFLRAQNWLVGREREFWSLAKQKGRQQRGDPKDGERFAAHFVEELEGWAAPSGEFQSQIDQMCLRPEVAKWIIPAFMAGIGAYLQIWRLHVLVQSDRSFISSETVKRFQAEVDRCRSGLIAAAAAWHQYCANVLETQGIAGTPEGNLVTRALTRAYAGTDEIGPVEPAGVPDDIAAGIKAVDSTPIANAVRDLDLTHKCLADDLAAINDDKPPRHLWKDFWVRPEPTTS